MASGMYLSSQVVHVTPIGRADGEPFDAKDFMKQHPEWNWQKGYLYDRPSQPWTLFD